jgi:hypothetical protein
MAIKASPYIPSFLRSALEDNRPMQVTLQDVKLTNIASTSSFIYEPSNSPLKNTQQLNVDWSKFENHTFFSSAEAKVSLTLEQIINGFPFDGTRAEHEAFFEKMTGFDKWVFDNFPKFKGHLAFSGTQAGEDPANGFAAELGTWIKVKDHEGALYPEISKKKSGGSVINPKNGASFTLEAQVFIPQVTNGKQVIFQKSADANNNLGLYIDGALSPTTSELTFIVVSGSKSIQASAPAQKGVFNHVCATWNRETSVDFVEMYVNEKLVSKSSFTYALGDLGIDDSNITIGSGTSVYTGGAFYTPVQTFSGSLDELRVFHSTRSIYQQEQFAKKAIFSTPDLKLYYRFNEPPPPLTPDPGDQVNSIVLDSSSNSLHALVQNFSSALRKDASADPLNPMIYEKPSTLPVLFPAYPATVSLTEELMMSASAYDRQNPNLITRLIPQHYLLEGAYAQSLPDALDADAVGTYGGTGMPGQGQMTSSQIIMSFLYIWARLFDELKLYIDAFSTLRYLDYTGIDNVPNNFLYDLVKLYGFHLPPLFNNSSIEQYVDGENIEYNISTEEFTLKDIQNELLRRVLINMPDVIRSKGTQHAIKSFLRAVGVDPNNTMRIREYGGPTTRALTFAREKKTDTGVMLQFSDTSLVLSPFLTGSRLEPGFPEVAGTMVLKDVYPPHGISDDENDGLFTSGSWSAEGIYKFNNVNLASLTSATQSLLRICNFDIPYDYPWEYETYVGPLEPYLIANLLAMSSSIDPKVVLYLRPGDDPASPALKLQVDLPPGGFFDNSRWNVSFGCERADSLGSVVSSSYFLRVANQNNGDIVWSSTTSSYFHEAPSGENNVLRQKATPTTNSFLAIGNNQSFVASTLFLNDISATPSEARVTNFDGQLAKLRFWSKALTVEEFIEHTRNYKSLGVHDPLVNYNFVTTRSGSFEKLRVDSISKQEDRTANALGELTLLDFSLNELHLSGTGFSTTDRSLLGELFDHSYLSPYFDEAATDEKVRVRGFESQSLVDATPWASVAPVHEIVRSERPTDDTRLSVEFSLIDALNRDIIAMFSTFDALDNALGAPELVYSPDYPDLARLRDVYFNRLREKINFQSFFEFFRWFDQSFGRFIEQLVPRKTMFKGTNFTIESHMLERNKLEYLSPEIYLGEEDRSRIRDVLLLQQLVGTLRKY